jgi:hypothetical protein
MAELHLPRKEMEQLDRQFWQAIDGERAAFLGTRPDRDNQTQQQDAFRAQEPDGQSGPGPLAS